MVAFNPLTPEFLENPFPLYGIGRGMGPMYTEAAGLWLVFRYEQISAILRNQSGWSSAATPGDVADPNPSMLFSDPPRHTRLRGLVNQAFTPRMVERLESRLRDVADQLLT